MLTAVLRGVVEGHRGVVGRVAEALVGAGDVPEVALPHGPAKHDDADDRAEDEEEDGDADGQAHRPTAGLGDGAAARGWGWMDRLID